MKKIHFILIIALYALFGCKKGEEVTPGSSSVPVSITLRTYMGWYGHKMAFDTVASGVYYDTFYYHKPVIYHILDQTEVKLYRNGNLIFTGYTDNKGEVRLDNISKDGSYTYSLKTKTLQDQQGNIFHYYCDLSVTYTTASVVKYFDIPFSGNGIGGQGTTAVPEVINPIN